MPVYKAEAVVLRHRPLGEADRVLTLFTREYGRLSAVARGVRRPSSKRSGALEPFSHLRLLLARGRGALDVVAQVEVVEGTGALRTDLRRFGQAALLAELVEAATPEREPQPGLFHLLVEALRLLRRPEETPAVLWFGLHLVSLAGFQPALERCAVGGEETGSAPAWSHPLGGVVCRRHAARDPAAVRLRPELVRVLEALLAAPAAEVGRLALPPDDQSLLLELVRRYAEHRLEVRLRSPGVLERLR
ncbi:MAG: DNA repair protein RecO [Armatimonadota bacterium]|nr:DNA repair protein RecO [Armatimonadota bacterium]MDR7539877.1 DNA repair protein RecO [Armatimonadota bacterium]